MKLSELSDAELETFLIKYIKYVAAIEREKARRKQLTMSTSKTTKNDNSATSFSISDDDLSKAVNRPLTKEDQESVTRILKSSGLTFGATEHSSSTLSYENVIEEIKKSSLKLSEKKMYLKGLQKDFHSKRCDEETLNKYLELIHLFKKGEAKTNPNFPRNAGIRLPQGLEEVLNEEFS